MLFAGCADGSQPGPRESAKPENLSLVMNDINRHMESREDPQVIHAAEYPDYIEVHLKELSDENIKLFKEKVSDSPSIRFKQDDGSGKLDGN